MRRLAALALASALLPAVAHADPCKAIPDRGPMPAFLSPGKTFSGYVVYVGDGDSLCVHVPPPAGPAGWVEVRLADYRAPELYEPGGLEAHALLRKVAEGIPVTCKAAHRSYDRVVAVCRNHGVSLARLLIAAGGKQGGR